MAELALDTNLLDAGLIASQDGPPYRLFQAWRDQDPVHWNPASPEYDRISNGETATSGFWVLTRHADVFAVSRDQKVFSSHEGGPTIWDYEGDLLATQRAGLMGMQPEMHTKVKRLVMPPFAPRELARFEPEIQKVAGEIIDDIAKKGSCEFIFDVASRLPVYTFCTLMGIPNELREEVFTLGNALADIETVREEGRGQEGGPLFGLFAIAEKLSAEKRENPDNSMLSMFIHGDVDGEKLDQMNINTFFMTMAIAGHETTRGTAGHFIRLMARHPDQFELLMSDLDKYLPNAIDEVLRYSPPVIKFRRTIMEDTSIGGYDVKKGEKVYLSYAAANRDPAVFEDPDRFDITRKNASEHLAFGTGPHVCLGARLAHMQLKALLTELYTRLPDIHPVGEQKMLRSIWFNAIMEMNCAFTPEA